METFLIIVHIIGSFVLIAAILLQSGKGGGLAAGFGGASAGTEVFGGAGAGGFLGKATVFLGGLFMATSLALAYLSSQPKSSMSLEGGGEVTTQEEEIVDPGAAETEDLAAPPERDQQPQGGSAPAPAGEAPAGEAPAGEAPAGEAPAPEAPAPEEGADE